MSHGAAYYLYEIHILLTKTTAAQREVALSYCRLRGLYFLAVVFAATIVRSIYSKGFKLIKYDF